MKRFALAFLLLGLAAVADSNPANEVRTHQTEIDGCDQSFKDNGGKAKGVIVIKWHIDNHGHATQSMIDEKHTTLKDDKLANCLLNIINSISFPETPAGQIISTSYRFIFE